MNFKLIIFGILLAVGGIAVDEAQSAVDCSKLTQNDWKHSIYANMSYGSYIQDCTVTYGFGSFLGTGMSVTGIGLALFGIIHGIIFSPKIGSDDNEDFVCPRCNEQFVCPRCNEQFGHGSKCIIPIEWSERYSEVCTKCYKTLQAGHD